jgi:hypothetical protein
MNNMKISEVVSRSVKEAVNTSGTQEFLMNNMPKKKKSAKSKVENLIAAIPKTK